MNGFKGEFLTDTALRLIYSTDASEYKQMPAAVAFPADANDIKILVDYARQKGLSLIPRGAGTSLAGQVVGKGIVVDVSKYMNKVLEINRQEQWVRVQPGIVLAELNELLKPYGLMFGPETSSHTRCTIGGMVGNNAAGLHSLVYGTTRDHILEVRGVLWDGSFATFGELSAEEFSDKTRLDTFEGKLYKHIARLLSDPDNQHIIRENYPDPGVKRRNTGYALDSLLDSEPFGGKKPFNFSRLLAGSEGTLMFFTEIKLNLVPLPPKHKALLAVHLERLEQAFEANIIALEFNPSAVELMDNTILRLARENKQQRENQFFIKGDPGAILIIELNADRKDEIEKRAKQIERAMRSRGYGYHFPLIWDDDTARVWALRNAGLGVLPNLYGEAKPVGVVEDTAVSPRRLPQYMREFQAILRKYDTEAVYYAHIGSGELHLRPVLNLRDPQDLKRFRLIATEVALLVRKYRGSLSGEHGDGRLRGEFIPVVLGQEVYQLLKSVKQAWDPTNVFNPGKIVNAPPMDRNLRLMPQTQIPAVKTYFSFRRNGGFTKALLKCNGSADCRKKQILGGTMCPSYKATEDERYSTRARANLLRELMIGAREATAFDHSELYEILDNCLMCKACKTECPSNVDMTKLKAEFLQHYYDRNGVPLRTWLIANLPVLNRFLLAAPGLANAAMNWRLTRKILQWIGFAPRPLPKLSKRTLHRWYRHYDRKHGRRIYLFNDEFTDQYDTDIGIKAILLFEALGYEVIIPKHTISGRTYLSKGLVRKAQRIINRNLALLQDLIDENSPLVGIEPSAILTFRDEALDLAYPHLQKAAEKIAANTFTFEEFVAREIDRGNIRADSFTDEPKLVKFHGHCYQKALSSTEYTKKILGLPVNYIVEEIPSGCCGMAGSFGYEKEHFDLSMKIGELVLFPSIRQSLAETVFAAPGTSCRHHIAYGTGKRVLHPVEILYEALRRD